MGTQQETLIYIEDQEKLDASVAANAFAHKDVKNRAYINTLGAELALKYLASEDIDVSNIYNIHSIKKILEEMDISDIMLPNIHMDVRVVFDENVIFIPKSHFEYNLVPDIYLVFYLAKDLSYVKFLGFFDPKLINKNNANDKYYFIEKEKLSSAKDLKKYIDSHQKPSVENITDEDLSNSERIIVAMSDNDISEEDKKFLIKQLTKSAELRDKFIEYENFETLSYKAMTDSEIKKPEPKIEAETTLTEENTLPVENEMQTQEISDIEDMELEPIDDIENITLDTIEPINEEPIESTEEAKKSEGNNNLADTAANIAGTIAAGAAAGAIAGAAAMAAGEVAQAASAVEGISSAAEAGMDLVNTGLDIAKDLTSNSNKNITNTSEPTDTISFDNVDTSSLDSGNVIQENIEQDSISLENVELPEVDTNADFVDTTDNTISFDNVDTSSLGSDDVVQENIEQDSISLENVELPEVDTNTEFVDTTDNKISFDNISTENQTDNTVEPLNINEETISLNDIDTSTIEPLEETSNFSEETISLDNIDTTNVEPLDPIENFDEETISFNDIQEQEAQTDTSDFMDDVVSLDDEIQTNLTEPENLNIENNQADVQPEVENTSIENSATPIEEKTEEPEIIENENKTQEGFGKNLLENLAPENLDNISIEDLGLDDESLPETNAEDVSSDDLLSQIDDVLSSSATSNTPVEVPETETTNSTDASLEDIANLDDLTDTQNTISDADFNDFATEALNNFEANGNNSSDLSDISELLGDSTENQPETAGENSNFGQSEENESIGVLFNDTDPATDAELDEIETPEYAQEQAVPGAALMKQKPKSNKSTAIVTIALVAVLAAASAVTFLKPKQDGSTDIVEPIAPQNSATENTNNAAGDSNDNILATNTPDIQNGTTVNVAKTQQPKELKNTAVKPKPKSADAYMDVSKLVWDVPDNLSYSPKMQNYLRTAGKSIKLSLSADLLLANEYAYTNQVKVNLKMSKDGAVQDARIASSSGSTQIDNIVLQSVKETLSVVKPPSDEVKAPDFNLGLIIYF